MRLFLFRGRQFGRRRALDLVASEIRDLEQRSESVSAEDPLLSALHQAMRDSVGHTAAQVPLLVDHEVRNANGEVCVRQRRSVDTVKMVPLWD